MQRNIKLPFSLLVHFVSLLTSIYLKPEYFEPFDDSLNFFFSVLAFVNALVFWSTTNPLFSYSWIRYDILFIIGFLVVHFQIPFLASIGIQPEKGNYIWININVVNYATWVSIIAMLLWQIGFLLKAQYQRSDTYQTFTNYTVDTSKLDVLLVVFFLFFIATVGNTFLSGSYNGTDNWGEGANYAYLLLSVTLYLKIIYFFINSSNNSFSKSNVLSLLIKNRVFIIILFGFVSIFLLVGDRGVIIEIFTLIVAGYSIYQKKIRFVVFLFGIMIVATAFTIISYGRTDDSSSRSGNIFEAGAEKFKASDSNYNVTDELASSNRILYRALDVVPESHPYLFGLTYLMDLVGVIPFAGGAVQKTIELPKMYTTSSFFFTILGQGNFYTSGEGSEILADIYINFGLYGIFILMFIFGYFVSYLSLRASIFKHHTSIIIYMLILMGAVYINRSNFLDPVKAVFYGWLFDKVLTKRIFYKEGIR